MSTSIPEAAEPVNLPDVVAPQIQAWRAAAKIWTPDRDFNEPDPRSAGTHVAWCVECSEAKAEGTTPHPVSSRDPFHTSHVISIPLAVFGPATPVGDAMSVPGIGVDVRSSIKTATGMPLVRLTEIRDGRTSAIGSMKVSEARQLITVLQLAIDLATGREDF